MMRRSLKLFLRMIKILYDGLIQNIKLMKQIKFYQMLVRLIIGQLTRQRMMMIKLWFLQILRLNINLNKSSFRLKILDSGKIIEFSTELADSIVKNSVNT